MATVLERTAPSQQVVSQIERRILEKTAGRVRNLRIHLAGDCVVLHGCSNTYYGKQLAQHGVLEVLPEANVTNAIEVC